MIIVLPRFARSLTQPHCTHPPFQPPSTSPAPSQPPSTFQGGAIYAATGSVQLANGTLFQNNSATTGATIYIDLAVVVYVLPAPAGHYISAAECRVTWASCPSGCQYSGEGCTHNMSATPSASSGGSCTLPPYNYQSCPWSRDINTYAITQGLLGKPLETLLAGELDTPTWPIPCGAGMLGASVNDVDGQKSALCAGRCPAGSYCPNEATMEPLNCGLGHYCPPGSFAPLPCPGGT